MLSEILEIYKLIPFLKSLYLVYKKLYKLQQKRFCFGVLLNVVINDLFLLCIDHFIRVGACCSTLGWRFYNWLLGSNRYLGVLITLDYFCTSVCLQLPTLYSNKYRFVGNELTFVLICKTRVTIVSICLNLCRFIIQWKTNLGFMKIFPK